MPNVYGKTSKAVWNTLHPKLQELVCAVLPYYDHSLVEGFRTPERHAEHLAAGRTTLTYQETNHRFNPSLAVDMQPYPAPKNADKDWKERVKFYELAAVMRLKAQELGIPIRWGGDWDGDRDYKDQNFDDLFHFELVGGPAVWLKQN